MAQPNSAAMPPAPVPVPQPLPQALYQRAAMINHRFSTVPEASFVSAEAVRTAMGTTAEIMLQVTAKLNARGGVDVGRVIAALDQLQAAKNTFIDSIILPHGPKNEAAFEALVHPSTYGTPGQ